MTMMMISVVEEMPTLHSWHPWVCVCRLVVGLDETDGSVAAIPMKFPSWTMKKKMSTL
jgi:hypothetical protein